MSQPRLQFFATTSSGLEPVLEGELRRMRMPGVKRTTGGVAFKGDRATMVKACVALRTAHRVLWTLGSFAAATPEALYDGVRAAVNWHGLVPPDKTFAVSASSTDSELGDTRYVALKTKDAIADAVRDAKGRRPDVDTDDPDVRVDVRVVRDRAILSLDASGNTALHARGYRTEAGEAPLRETVAAGLVLQSGWRADVPLVDPLCGSGTIAIEAAMIGRRQDPGLLGRSYGFERWPGHRPERLASEKQHAEKVVRDLDVPILGLDHDEAVLAAARENARRAKVAGSVEFRSGAIERLDNPFGAGSRGVIVTNPPWGERLGEIEALRPFYEAFGRALRRGFTGWDVWILLAHRVHRDALGLPVIHEWKLRNGPIDVVATRFGVD